MVTSSLSFRLPFPTDDTVIGHRGPQSLITLFVLFRFSREIPPLSFHLSLNLTCQKRNPGFMLFRIQVVKVLSHSTILSLPLCPSNQKCFPPFHCPVLATFLPFSRDLTMRRGEEKRKWNFYISTLKMCVLKHFVVVCCLSEYFLGEFSGKNVCFFGRSKKVEMKRIEGEKEWRKWRRTRGGKWFLKEGK